MMDGEEDADSYRVRELARRVTKFGFSRTADTIGRPGIFLL